MGRSILAAIYFIWKSDEHLLILWPEGEHVRKKTPNGKFQFNFYLEVSVEIWETITRVPRHGKG